MRIRDNVSKSRIILLLLVIFILLTLLVILTQPFFVYRLSSKVFTAHEIYLLKYPDSYLVETEIRATTKVTMVTEYIFYSSDDIDFILKYMEQKRPGFVQLQGSRVIIEPTFRNITCADETEYRNIFQVLEKGAPCIEVSIYSSPISGTFIRISEHWPIMGFPPRLRRW